MRFLIITCGGSGDVMPFMALARTLNTVGHEVILGAPSTFGELAWQQGLSILPLDTELDEEFIQKWRKILRASPNEMKGVRNRVICNKMTASAIARYHDGIANAVNSAVNGKIDIVIYHHPLTCGDEVAERLGAINVPVCLQPFYIPTNSFSILGPQFDFLKSLNRVSYSYFSSYWRALHGYSSRLRKRKLGVNPRRGYRNALRQPDGSPTTVLQAFSRHILPNSVHYPSWAHTTSFWRLPKSPKWAPPKELAEFLEAGEDPVCVGFGSSVGTDPEKTTRVVVEAARIAGVRAILVGGSGGITDSAVADDVFYIDEAPFDWLFPRMSAIVHHGGIGTASAALVAGKPQVICPFGGEHEFFAERMVSLGVASRSRPERELSSLDLAHCIRNAVANQKMDYYAKQVGRKVAAEEGTTMAVRLLESLAKER